MTPGLPVMGHRLLSDMEVDLGGQQPSMSAPTDPSVAKNPPSTGGPASVVFNAVTGKPTMTPGESFVSTEIYCSVQAMKKISKKCVPGLSAMSSAQGPFLVGLKTEGNSH
jgi:hypothetical protein